MRCFLFLSCYILILTFFMFYFCTIFVQFFYLLFIYRENISSAYGDIPGVTPVRAEGADTFVEEDSSMIGGGGGIGMENPEEELPSAMAASNIGIVVDNTKDETKVESSPLPQSVQKNEKMKNGLENLDSIIDSDAKGKGNEEVLKGMISPRPGEKGSAPMDEGKVSQTDEGKTAL